MLFLLYRQLLQQGKMTRLRAGQWFKLLNSMVQFVFALAFVGMLLGAAGFVFVRVYAPLPAQIQLSGTVTDGHGPARGVTVVASGSPLFTQTNDAGFFRLSVERSALRHDSVSLVFHVGDRDSLTSFAVADTPLSISLSRSRGVGALASTNPPGTAKGDYGAVASAAAASLAAAQGMVRLRRFGEARDLTQGILLRERALGSTNLPAQPALVALHQVAEVANDSLTWLEDVADTLQKAAALILPQVKSQFSHRLFCETVSSAQSLVSRHENLQSRYPDYPPTAPVLRQLRDILNAADDSLRALRHRGQASTCA